MDLKTTTGVLSIWLSSSLALLIAAVAFGENVVLGNRFAAQSLAVLIAGLLLSFSSLFNPYLIQKLRLSIKDERLILGLQIIITTGVLWFVKRLAFVSGVGISNVFWVIITAVLVVLMQWGVTRLLTQLFRQESKITKHEK